MNVLKIYNDTYWSLINLDDKVYEKKKNGTVDFVQGFLTDEKEKERVSLSRTKRRIKEICLCNDFEYFVTMTVSSKIYGYNRFDYENCLDYAKVFMKKIKRKSKDFKYIYVCESHEKGGYHFHGMMKNLPKDDIYTNKNGYLSSHMLDGLGFNSFSKIQDYNKCCNYITKYISKDVFHDSEIYSDVPRYFCSRGLNKPHEEFMLDTDLSYIFGKKPTIDKETGEIVGEENDFYSNQYCQKKDFDLQRLTERQKLKLNAYFNESDKFFEKDNNYITNLLKLFTKPYNSYKIQIHK